MDKIVKYIITNELDVALRAVQHSAYDISVFDTFFSEISIETVQVLIDETTDRDFCKLVMRKFGDAVKYPERFADIEILEQTGTWMTKRLKKNHLPLTARVVQTGYIVNGVPEWKNHSIDVRIEGTADAIELETGEIFTEFDNDIYYNDDHECCRICY